MKSKDLVTGVSAGLFCNSIDLVLFSASLGLNLFAASFKAKDPISVLVDSVKLANKFQGKMLSVSSAYAKRKGFLQRRRLQLQLTKKGEAYIKEKLPVYQRSRPWQGRLYLITYDILESSRKKRNLLRSFLLEHKAAMIQQSVWVSVNDLSESLGKLSWLKPGDGTVLVSVLKKGKGIGEETIEALIKRVYKLDNINLRYQQFIKGCQKKWPSSQEEKLLMQMKYLAILRDDPQLQRNLLTKDWHGDKAHELFLQINK